MSTEKIRALNDAFRTTMTGGRVVMTAGVDALPSDVKAMVIRRVATFADFTAGNDPQGEHDFGSFELAGQFMFWKIALSYGVRSGTAVALVTRKLVPCPTCRLYPSHSSD